MIATVPSTKMPPPIQLALRILILSWAATRCHRVNIASMECLRSKSLRMMMEEGIDNRIRRHASVAASLRAGLEALGIGLLADPVLSSEATQKRE